MKPLPGSSEFITARRRMVSEQVEKRGVSNKRVLDALREVPRHIFADDALRFQAYGGHALPIGWEQTLSQPYVVGKMSEALRLTGVEKVLEVGTGSGYQAAVLSRLAGKVYSMERIPDLARRARKTLDNMRIRNVVITAGDASRGWRHFAPFDRILFTAGAESIPPALMDQLADPGILVAPVGTGSQRLVVIQREGGKDRSADLGPCEFVPFIPGASSPSGKFHRK